MVTEGSVRHIPHACFWASCNIHCGLNILLVLRNFLLKFETNSCSVLVGNPERKRNLPRPSHDWDDNIKVDFKETRRVVGDCVSGLNS